jgi:HEAT repeat protein
MAGRRGKRIAMWTCVAALLLVAGAAVISRDALSERWWLWKLKYGKPEEAIPAAIRLLEMQSLEAVPRILDRFEEIARDANNNAGANLGIWFVVVGEGLEKLGPRAVPPITQLLDRNNPVMQEIAMEALGKMGSCAAPAVPRLLQALKREEGLMRIPAICALGDIGREARTAVPDLADCLRHGGDRHTRGFAAEALGKMGTDARPALPALLEALGDGDSYVRIEAAIAIAEVAGKEGEAAVPVLKAALTNPTLPRSQADRARDALRKISAPSRGRYASF